MKKTLFFGIVGALGCLVGGLLGEGYWAAVNRLLPAGGSSGSLADPARAPALRAVDVAAAEPPPPLTVAAPLANPPRPVPPEIKQRLERAGADSGDIELSLAWSGYDDLDLHCKVPNGDLIWWQAKRSSSGGWLDIDANMLAKGPADSASTQEPVEHIRWKDATAVPAGEYLITVRLFKAFGTGKTVPYTLHVKAPGLGEVHEGTLGDSHKTDSYRIRLPAAGLLVAAPDEIVADQGGVNWVPVRIARNGVTGPVQVRFVPTDGGSDLTFAEDGSATATIGAGDDAVTSLVRAGPFAAPGRRGVRVIAETGNASAEAGTTIVVREVPLAIRLSAPADVTVPAGATNSMSLRVARDHFEGPVEVRFEHAGRGVDLPSVTIPADRDEADVTIAATADAPPGEVPIRAVAVGTRDGRTCEATAELKARIAAGARASWLNVPLTGGWTALLAMGLSMALVVAQSRYQSRLPELGGMIGVLLAAAVAGLAAGAAGQVLRNALAERQLPPGLGFLGGWLVFGGLLGWGIGWFIPNVKLWRAAVAGLVGGGIGGLALLAPTLIGLSSASGAAAADNAWAGLAARAAGTGILGLSLGLMVAIAETLFREAWLDVHYGPGEKRTFTLGSTPLTLGGGGGCTVFVRDAAPQPVTFTLADGKILRTPPCGTKGVAVPAGHEERLGRVRIVVGARGTGTTAGRATTPASFVLRLADGRRIEIRPGVRLTDRDLPGLVAAAGDGVVAEVVAKPSDPSVLGLRNASRARWRVTDAASVTAEVPPGRVVMLQRGSTIMLGERRAEVS